MTLEYSKFPDGGWYLASPHITLRTHENDIDSNLSIFCVPFPIRVWKKVYLQKTIPDVIELEIPGNTPIHGKVRGHTRSQPTSNVYGPKFRAARAFVLGNSSPRRNWESCYAEGFFYRKGFMVYPKENFWMYQHTCAGGIHFFLTPKAAWAY